MTSASFMTFNATFIRLATDTTMQDKKYSPTVAPKGLVDIIPTFDDDRAIASVQITHQEERNNP